MTSSPDPLPPALPAMWRALKLGYRHEPKLMAAAFLLSQLSAVPDALLAWWLKVMAEAVSGGDPRRLRIAALALALTAAGTWFLTVLSTRVQRRFRDKVTIALESHVARLQADIVTIAHQERPEFLDRLSILRNQVFVLDHMYMSLFSTCGWILRLAVTLGLLAAIHPALALLALFAVPTVLTSGWRPAVERAAEERRAQAARLAQHHFTTATTAAAGKEVRVTGISARLVRDRRQAWEWSYAPIAKARFESALWHSGAWAVFGLAYVGAIVFVTSFLHAAVGNVLLVLAAGGRLSWYLGAAVGEIGFLRGFWLDGSRRLAWLEDYADSLVSRADAGAPTRLDDGIRFEKVSFAYPGTEKLVLQDVDLHLPAGSVVALVGENGAGKSTLVKLLCQLYQPTAGRILVEGAPLDRMRPTAWRARMAGAFQDFYRFELEARLAVGLGDVPRRNDDRAVGAAVERAGAEDVVARLPRGLATQLGPTWPEGVEVSFGQWQKLALARGFMREEPLVLVLDEPTAALDAETEHALFERYAAAARGPERAAGGRTGGITLLVSHRFSTVRMADLIVVLDGARVVEVGGHKELLARRGPYSELYGIQASAYR